MNVPHNPQAPQVVPEEEDVGFGKEFGDLSKEEKQQYLNYLHKQEAMEEEQVKQFFEMQNAQRIQRISSKIKLATQLAINESCFNNCLLAKKYGHFWVPTKDKFQRKKDKQVEDERIFTWGELECLRNCIKTNIDVFKFVNELNDNGEIDAESIVDWEHGKEIIY